MLPKFTKVENELMGILDKWIYFIKNAGNLDYIPKYLDAELNRAFEIANEVSDYKFISCRYGDESHCANHRIGCDEG